MPITVTWLDDARTAIMCSFAGTWSWEEFHQSLDDVVKLFPDGSRSVSSVVDFTGSRGLPPGAPFAHARRAFRLFEEQPNYSGYMVAVTTRTFTVMLVRVMITTGVAPGLLLARRLEDALPLLRAKLAKNPPVL